MRAGGVAQRFLHPSVDQRGAVGDQHDGTRGLGGIVGEIGECQRQPPPDVGEGEAGAVYGGDGGLHDLMMVGERQHRHGRGGERRDGDAVMGATGNEVREQALGRRRFRFLIAGRGAVGEAVVHARRSVEQQHHMGAGAFAGDGLLAPMQPRQSQHQRRHGKASRQPKHK